MREPISVVTNAAYPLAAIAAVLVAGWDVDGAMQFALMSLLLGICSAGYHYTLDRCWQSADEVAMYGTFGLLLGIGAAVAGVPLHHCGLILGFTAGLVWFSDAADSHVWVPILVLGNLIAVGFVSGWEFAVFGFALYLAAVIVRYIGQEGKKEGDLHGHDIMHGIWHVMTGAANSYIYLNYAGYFIST